MNASESVSWVILLAVLAAMWLIDDATVAAWLR